MRLMALVEALEIVPILDIDHVDQMKILDIRNEPKIRNNMYTNHVISKTEHLNWLNGLKSSDSTRFFVVYLNKNIIGGVSLSALSLSNKKSDWAYYISEIYQGKRGIGAALEFKFLNIVFDELKLHKLNCEVLAFNEAVISLHKRFGFIEEGCRRDHIFRDGQFYDTILLGITDREWGESKNILIEKLFR